MSDPHGPDLDTLKALAEGLSENEFSAYAERVAERWPALGVWLRLLIDSHAPRHAIPLSRWPHLTMVDVVFLRGQGVRWEYGSDAQALWERMYGMEDSGDE